MDDEHIPIPVTPFLLSVTALVALVLGYLWLVQKMRAAKIERPPYVHYLVIVIGIACALVAHLWLLLRLLPHHLFDGWSLVVQAESAGYIGLQLVGLALLFMSIFLFKRRNTSPYHKVAFWSGLAYVSFVILVIFLAIFILY